MNAASSSSTKLGWTSKATSYGAGFGGKSGHCRCAVRAAAATATRSTDYYKVLSLEHSADVGEDDVKRAYRRLALQYHPDVCPPSRRAESTELFVELRRAYETLSDPATRVQYDAELRTGTAARQPGGGFPKDVWEAQLCVLRTRSERRQTARAQGGAAATGSRNCRTNHMTMF